MTNEGDSVGQDANQEGEAPDVSKRENRFEVVATLLLALAALATAWTGCQASLWDGVQSSNCTLASAARTQAAQLRTEGNQFQLADLSLFENYVDATIGGDEELASFYRDRFRAEFVPAFESWVALDPFNDPNAPPSPFTSPLYQLEPDEEAKILEVRAGALFAEGEDANTYSDVYTMSTLLFAGVLFFAAIAAVLASVAAVDVRRGDDDAQDRHRCHRAGQTGLTTASALLCIALARWATLTNGNPVPEHGRRLPSIHPNVRLVR